MSACRRRGRRYRATPPPGLTKKHAQCVFYTLFTQNPLDRAGDPGTAGGGALASAKDTTDFWFLASGRSQLVEDVQGGLGLLRPLPQQISCSCPEARPLSKRYLCAARRALMCLRQTIGACLHAPATLRDACRRLRY